MESYCIKKILLIPHNTDKTIGKTLDDGTKKFTLDEAIRIAGDELNDEILNLVQFGTRNELNNL